MLLEFKRRAQPSRLAQWTAPVVAFALTLLTGALIFLSLGKDPMAGLYYFFVEPLTAAWSLEEVAVKMIPLAIIAIGLCVCFLSSTWNIGAEGQFIVGALAGSAVPILLPGFDGPLMLPLMMLCGFAGGMAYGLIPATLKVRFGANEILTSLMLVYVAELLLDWLVRGPWRNPEGFNMPESAPFPVSGRVPELPFIDADRLTIALVIAVIAAIVVQFMIRRTIFGFSVRLAGIAPRAAAFAGYDANRTVLLALGVSGGLAGLAGILEVAGPIGQLRPAISPGYGFTAIIVAFLARLSPIGCLAAAFVLSLTYIGGEGAQIAMGLSDKMARVFQGILLFWALVADAFVFYEVRLKRAPAIGPSAEAADA
ncbi:MAG: ABC transporter permease [Pseudomonadota bacterium]